MRPVTEEVVSSAVAAVGSARMRAVHHLQTFGEASAGRPEDEVVVVGHETPGRKLPAMANRRPVELTLERGVIVAIPCDRPPIAAAAGDVVPAIALDDPQLASHASNVGSALSRERRGFRTEPSRLTPGHGSARPAK